MIRLMFGTKGTGKTKALIRSVDEAVKIEKGNIVCLTKGNKLNSKFGHDVRLIDIGDFTMSNSYKVFYGFLCGVISQNFDITHIFVDRITRLVSDDLVAFAEFITFVEQLSKKFGVSFTITVSADPKDAPEAIAKYIVEF